jgi:hypothetical protein
VSISLFDRGVCIAVFNVVTFLYCLQFFLLLSIALHAGFLRNAQDCHFLFLDEKKVTKEKSSQARSLRAA